MSVRTNIPRPPPDPLSPPPESTDTSLNFGPLRTRSVVVNHSLQSQWRGVARSAGDNAHLSDKQRFLLLLGLFAISGILIVWTLHSAPPHHPHPALVLNEQHVANNPHMLKHLNQKLMAAAAPIASSIASPYSVLYVTVPNAEVAEKLASGLLQKKLVACANIIPTVTSMYWWEGKIQKEQEQLIMLKTRSALFSEVSAYVKANHPYQVPEVIELPIQQGHKDYLEWIGENSKDPKEE